MTNEKWKMKYGKSIPASCGLLEKRMTNEKWKMKYGKSIPASCCCLLPLVPHSAHCLLPTVFSVLASLRFNQSSAHVELRGAFNSACGSGRGGLHSQFCG